MDSLLLLFCARKLLPQSRERRISELTFSAAVVVRA